MTIKHKLIYYLAAMLLLPIVVGAVGLTILQNRGGQLVSIGDYSMEPSLHNGDALIIMPVKSVKIEAGQVIAFMDPFGSKRLVVRRVSSVDYKKGLIQTIGDNGRSYKQPLSFESVTGRAVASGPMLGHVYDALQRPMGLFLVVYLPVLAVILAEAYRLITLSPITANLLDYKHEPKRSKI